MNTVSKVIIINMLLIVLFLVTVNFNITQHEEVHKLIFNDDGCLNTSVTQNYLLLSGKTSCTHGLEYNESPQAELLHGYNEIVSYNVSSIIVCFFILIMIISTLMILLIDKEKVN